MILERFKPAAGDIVQVPEPSLRQTVMLLKSWATTRGCSRRGRRPGVDGPSGGGISRRLQHAAKLPTAVSPGILNPKPQWRIVREFQAPQRSMAIAG